MLCIYIVRGTVVLRISQSEQWLIGATVANGVDQMELSGIRIDQMELILCHNNWLQQF